MNAVRFREGLLAGRTVAVTCAGDRLAALGASVEPVPDAWSLDEAGADAWATALAGRRNGVDALVADASEPFGRGGAEGLAAALDGSWRLARALAAAAMIPGERGGAIVLVAPRPAAGPHAGAARAGLENLARTLSVEWARFAVRVAAIAPAATTPDSELWDLVAWLLSPAGGYVSGCALELTGLARPDRAQ